MINDTDSVPFEYEIETIRIKLDMENIDKRKIKTYVYKFTVNADYELEFPLGLYQIGQKGGDVLQGNSGLVLVRKRN